MARGCDTGRRWVQRLRVGAVLALVVAFPLQGLAHDLYVMPSAFTVKRGQAVTVAFHNGDAFPESEVAPTPARLREAKVNSARGTAEIRGLRIAGNETLGEVVMPAGGSLVASVVTVPNFIELAPAKFTDYLKEEGLNEVVEWRARHMEADRPGRERYQKFAKALLQSAGANDRFYERPLGLTIEIVPLANPYELHKGGALPVRVLFEGKPIAGLQVEAARAASGGKARVTVVGTTDAEGRVNVPIDQAGKWRLHSLRMQRVSAERLAAVKASDSTVSGDKVPDWESFWASLTFEIS